MPAPGQSLIKFIKHQIRQQPDYATLGLFWTQAHEGIELNELADTVAGRAAKTEGRRTRVPMSLPSLHYSRPGKRQVSLPRTFLIIPQDLRPQPRKSPMRLTDWRKANRRRSPNSGRDTVRSTPTCTGSNNRLLSTVEGVASRKRWHTSFYTVANIGLSDRPSESG
ncbi:hypothetical protein CROQUDRAFT_187320 [Cronartium quercuum f. sp. fusiforme G11]|uniref:RNase H type-1 domain-containing protein n=1 Tax=Cronartium quercuum f. sp. fusiforme G11 TaxID=708437 RepID=A0A9P6T9A8_9BASI|nr:hypothetical protein CROQUDRAFT_187320 [Cronartium quercuum f. sp. fusiforme G11]